MIMPGLNSKEEAINAFVIECRTELLSQYFIRSELLARVQDEFGKDRYSDGG